jgi:hypothetical protein
LQSHFFFDDQKNAKKWLLRMAQEWLLVSVSVRIVGLQLQLLSSHHSLPRCETNDDMFERSG